MGEARVVVFLRSLEDERGEVLGEGPTVLTALHASGLLETIEDRASRIERAEARLRRYGLVAALDPETAHDLDRARVDAASTRLAPTGR